MLRISFILVVFVMHGTSVTSQTTCKNTDKDPCKCDLNDGSGVVDLTFGKQDSALFKDVPNPYGVNELYSYNPCYAFQSADGTHTGLAAMMTNSTVDSDIGQQSSATFSLDFDNNLTITYVSSDRESTSVVTLQCQRSGNLSLSVQEQVQFGNYGFILNGPELCPVSEAENGLSGGSIFLIIFCVLFYVYLIGGIIYKKIMTDGVGTDLIPNKDFWTSLPGLIKDGVMFLVYKCKGRPDSTYEGI